ncbi:uncharacterized protein [Solanum lycopersicum]|uniref:uncharacterized protein isoform X2 n=1 Tax=Solanum lycopersicum TaxID=4081 RepID=UPI00374A5C1C
MGGWRLENRMLKTAGTFESYTVSAHILNFSFLQTCLPQISWKKYRKTSILACVHVNVEVFKEQGASMRKKSRGYRCLSARSFNDINTASSAFSSARSLQFLNIGSRLTR